MSRTAVLALACAVLLGRATLPAAADDGKEAEKLYQQMEEKVAKAKSIEMSFEVEIASPGQKEKGTIKGSLALAEGNKMRLEYKTKLMGMEGDATLISDGKKEVALSAGRPLGEAGPTPKDLERKARRAVSPNGFFFGLLLGTPGGVPDLKASDFKLGKRQKVGDRQAQAVEYTSTIKGDKNAMATVVWIDLETKVPLKRSFRMKEGDREISMSEMFSGVKLDGKIDPKKFELPKDSR